MKKYALVLASVLVVAPVSMASAATIDIKYGLAVTAVLGGAIPIGPPALGMATIQYNAPPGGSISGVSGLVSHGGARILTLTLAGPLGFVVLGDTFTGQLNLNLGAQPNGNLFSTGQLLTLPLRGTVGGTIHCFGGTCTGLGIPPSITQPLSLAFNTILSATNVTPASTPLPILTFAGVSFGTFGGLAITATFTLGEVSRHYVPEPTTLPLVAGGILVLAGLGRAGWRARR